MSADPLAALHLKERNELEALLLDFDARWAPGSFEETARQVRSHSNQQYGDLALAELVKVDLHRSWSAGNGRMLEDYLGQFPSLGTNQTVAADLVVAEFDARSSVNADLVLASYESRFPHQFPMIQQLVSQLAESNVTDSSSPKRTERELGQASIDTSRIDNLRDTKDGKKRETALELPVEFGRYRILKELGSGAMGKVYLAHDSQLDRQVALKTPSFSGSSDEDMVTRFYREARAAAKIQHRNICPIYDVGEIDGRHFITMAFIKGRCMSEFIKPDRLPPHRTSAILVQRLAVALSEAHKHNVIHRDLKPANIMIDLKNEPIVMDFGLARQLDIESRVTQSGMAVGTPAYMSPEQIRGELDEVGTSADIYALGVILYELLTGQLPFRGPIAKVVYSIVNDIPTAPSQLRDDIDPELESICAKMMAKKRDDRYASMDEVASELKAYLKGQSRTTHSRVSAAGKPTSSDVSNSPQLTETGALNAFFAAQADTYSRGTLVEPAAKSKSAAVATARTTASQSSRNNSGRSLLVASGFAGGVALLLGIIIYFNGGKVELDSNTDAVVNVDTDGSVTIRPGLVANRNPSGQDSDSTLAQDSSSESGQTTSTPIDPKISPESTTDDRDIAKQIVEFGGNVHLADGSKWTRTLPDGEIRVVRVSFFRKQNQFHDGHIALLGKLPNLRSVVFYPNKMTNEGIATLAEMENVVENVTSLYFNRVQLTPEGLTPLAKLKRLDSLSLHHTDLINEDLKLLSNFKSLRELTLSQQNHKKFGPTFLTDEGIKHLKTVPNLRKLTLIGDQYTDSCVLAAADLEIEELWLSTPNITDDAINQLREKRPRLGVTRFKESP